MDELRLRKLAGIDTSLQEEIQAVEKELDLLEKMYQGKNVGVDTGALPIEEVQRRMEAATRALGLVNRLRDPEYRKRHVSRIMSNMNTIRAALQYMLKQADEEI